MHIIHGLPDLVRHLSAHTQDQLPDTHWIDLPSASLLAFAPLRTQPNSGDEPMADAATQLARITSTLAPAEPASSQAGTRMLVRAADAPPRMGHGPWLPVAVLRQMAWPAGQDLHSADWQGLLRAEFVRSDRFASLFAAPWADADVPAPAWPEGATPDAHLTFWANGLKAMAWTNDEPLQPTPATGAELRLCEWRLGCSLPPALRAYLLHLGHEDFGEVICGASGTLPLLDAYPGIEDMLEDLPDGEAQALRAQVDQLVAFGDYLGNGNLWCFHRQTAAVWYFDHDSPPPLSHLFDDVADYLDTLAIKAQCVAHAYANGEGDGDEQAESMLVARLGRALVRKWQY